MKKSIESNAKWPQQHITLDGKLHAQTLFIFTLILVQTCNTTTPSSISLIQGICLHMIVNTFQNLLGEPIRGFF
jgi:hypothetical protein